MWTLCLRFSSINRLLELVWKTEVGCRKSLGCVYGLTDEKVCALYRVKIDWIWSKILSIFLPVLSEFWYKNFVIPIFQITWFPTLLRIGKIYNSANNLHHHPWEMYIAATVTFVLTYDKIMNSALMRHQITECTKHVYFSTAFYQKCILHTYSSYYFKYFDLLC